jgi:hypothetical protein
MTAEITRVTMIKLPSEKHILIALEGFQNFTKRQKKVFSLLALMLQKLTNTQDGKPYIISMQAGPAQGTVKDQGFNFVTKSVFKNKEDMAYYETECEGHNEFKIFLKEKAPVSELMTVYFTPGYSYKA